MNTLLVFISAAFFLYLSVFTYMKVRLAINLRRGEACHGKKCNICTAYRPPKIKNI